VTKYAAWLVSLAAVAAAAKAADADGLAHCAGIAAPSERLACYDALAHRPADKTPPTPAATAATAAAAPPAASAAAISAADRRNFGFSLAQQHMAFAGPKSIDARITAVGSSPHGQTNIVLDSGQTWVVSENDGWLSKGDAITIKRASLGAYLLTAPSNHIYYVRRIQ
jgi:hypothetical protein